MEDAFRKVVEHIFNNWTGLKLAVEYETGGPNSKTVALECLDYMTQYCLYEPNIGVGDIQEALDDIMDQEFETICEDGSTMEIAVVLDKFLQIVKRGDVELYQTEFNKLPCADAWLVKTQSVRMEANSSTSQNNDANSVNESIREEVEEKAAPMEEEEEDPGWTTVKSRKKR